MDKTDKAKTRKPCRGFKKTSHVERRPSNSASLLPGAFGLATKPRWNGWNGSSRKSIFTKSLQILIQIIQIKKITSQLTSIYWNLHLLKCTAATHSFLKSSDFKSRQASCTARTVVVSLPVNVVCKTINVRNITRQEEPVASATQAWTPNWKNWFQKPPHQSISRIKALSKAFNFKYEQYEHTISLTL